MNGDCPHPEVSWETLDRFTFGDQSELADELLDLVLRRLKTATCWPIEEGQQTEVGRKMVVCDGKGRSRAVLETVAIEQVAFNQVNQAFATKEAEGDTSLDYWRHHTVSILNERASSALTCRCGVKRFDWSRLLKRHCKSAMAGPTATWSESPRKAG